ncbi:MAG: RNA polymerase factor sigma-54 [Hyphomicrobiaceae bacterium]
MTPQLQQAIRLLQLSNLELVEFVDAEIERNPLLEHDEPQADPEPAAASEDRGEAEAPAEDGAWLDLDKTTPGASGALDADYSNTFQDTDPVPEAARDAALSNWTSVRQSGGSSLEDSTGLESFVATERSLADHLTEQLQVAITDPVERLIGAQLVHFVDDAGYLQGDVHDLAAKLGTTPQLVEAVLLKLQQLDPPGIFARDLAECLALQLKDQNRYDPQIARLLDNLSLLAAHNLTALKRAVNVDAQELAEMIAEIKQLNPKPGLKYGTVQVQPVLPDVLVRAAPDGSWLIELNTDTLPRVLVNRSYYTLVSGTTRTDKDRTYLLDCLQTANWLIKSLDQRARTILKVAEEIVRQQDGFLTHGVEYLRPLNLKTVADAIQMHESTVSRVTSNKYISTPRGIFELKYFFTSAIASAEDASLSHSSESVRHKIRQLIEAETAHSVISDDKLVELLKRDGVDIARRTVAKYREAMRIPSSVQRRREKQMADRLTRAV